MISLKDCDNYIPDWVQEKTNWFSNTEQAQKTILLNVSSEEHYWKIGKMLVEKLILKKEYGWIYAQAAFDNQLLVRWVEALNQQVVNFPDDFCCFQYGMYNHPHPVIPNYAVYEIEWMSISKSNKYPLDGALFSNIPSMRYVDDDLLIISPKMEVLKEMKSNLDLASEVMLGLRPELVSGFFGSWIYPLEEYRGFYVGNTQGEEFFAEFQERDWYLDGLMK